MAAVQHALQNGITTGTRFALVFAFIVVAIGAVVSFLIPNVGAVEVERMMHAGDLDLEIDEAQPATG